MGMGEGGWDDVIEDDVRIKEFSFSFIFEGDGILVGS